MNGSIVVTVEVHVRPAAEPDLASLSTWSSAVSDVFKPALAGGDCVVLVARANDRFPIAQILVAFKSPEPSVGILSHLVVLGGFRKQGVGTSLLEEGHRLLREAGLSRSQLAVEKRNVDARRLYERLGYEVSGETLETWPEPTADGQVLPVAHPAWVMRKALS